MYIKTSIKNSIGYLNIDRPESLNAMNDEVLDEFISKINDLNSEPTIRVIIISGAGDKAFIACLLYTSPSPRDGLLSRMPSSA